MTIVNVVMTIVNVVMTIVNVVMTIVNVVMTIVNVVMTIVNVVITTFTTLSHDSRHETTSQVVTRCSLSDEPRPIVIFIDVRPRTSLLLLEGADVVVME